MEISGDLSECERNLIVGQENIVLIGFDNAGKRFGTLDAVKEFSMTIRDEEILGLLGPNGAGKTTLMLMMGTVYRPTSGKISVNGLDVVQHPNDVSKMIGIPFH